MFLAERRYLICLVVAIGSCQRTSVQDNQTEYRWDAGVILVDDGENEPVSVSHAFEIVNPFHQTMSLRTGKTSCGCTSLRIGKQRLDAKATTKVEMVIKRTSAGRVVEDATIETGIEGIPPMRLVLAATLLPRVEVTARERLPIRISTDGFGVLHCRVVGRHWLDEGIAPTFSSHVTSGDNGAVAVSFPLEAVSKINGSYVEVSADAEIVGRSGTDDSTVGTSGEAASYLIRFTFGQHKSQGILASWARDVGISVNPKSVFMRRGADNKTVVLSASTPFAILSVEAPSPLRAALEESAQPAAVHRLRIQIERTAVDETSVPKAQRLDIVVKTDKGGEKAVLVPVWLLNI